MNFSVLNNTQEYDKLKRENNKLKLLLDKMQIVSVMDSRIELLEKENSENKELLRKLYDKCNELKNKQSNNTASQELVNRENEVKKQEANNILVLERLNECGAKYNFIRNDLVKYKEFLDKSNPGLKELEIKSLNGRVEQLERELHKYTKDNEHVFLDK